ncbi:unnamed protein product [Blepharisma stoltei]|uniref:Uncharacterized protein n=1 Tax=Blepharisma stoltei TaxID=1481888 RepID=A0AAU9IN15_9CILI|nr:unnamed protein product [Blepharisma stoltei]
MESARNQKLVRLFTSQNEKLSEEYRQLKHRYDDIIRSKSTGRSSATPQISLKSQSGSRLKCAKSLLKVLKNDKVYLEHRRSISPQQDDYAYNLQLQIQDQLRTILKLEKENKKLNKEKCVSASTDTIYLNPDGGLIREIARYRKMIEKIEEEEINNKNKLKEYQIRSHRLEEELNDLHESGYNITEETDRGENNEDTYRILMKKLKLIEKIWRSNMTKFQQRIKDLEKEQKELQDEAMALQSKTFKKMSQQRLLKVTFDDYKNLNKERYFSKDNDFYHPDINFLYKPSINSLYS